MKITELTPEYVDYIPSDKDMKRGSAVYQQDFQNDRTPLRLRMWQ